LNKSTAFKHQLVRRGILPKALKRGKMTNSSSKSAPQSSFVPLSPNERPQQRLNLVQSLGPRPEGFSGHVSWIDGPPQKPPLRSPRNVERVCSVEWAWSPTHDRLDSYYINEKPNYWALWKHELDDGSSPWRWTWRLYAYAPKVSNEDVSTIVAYMLFDAWTDEARAVGLDHYHWINETGILDTETVQAIGRAVWGNVDYE
jgi:hypothetical protein